MIWDDELWEEVWDRTLDGVERHHVAISTWRRELPSDPLHRRLVPELARRWRRTARNHFAGHLLWVLFWGAIALSAEPGGPADRVGTGMALFSLLVLATCVAVRRYLWPVTRFG